MAEKQPQKKDQREIGLCAWADAWTKTDNAGALDFYIIKGKNEHIYCLVAFIKRLFQILFM